MLFKLIKFLKIMLKNIFGDKKEWLEEILIPKKEKATTPSPNQKVR